jgi:hypothetical protein
MEVGPGTAFQIDSPHPPESASFLIVAQYEHLLWKIHKKAI